MADPNCKVSAKATPFYLSKRFWSAVATGGGALAAIIPKVVVISPPLGLVLTIAGVVMVVAGNVGMAVFGMSSTSPVAFKLPNGAEKPEPVVPKK